MNEPAPTDDRAAVLACIARGEIATTLTAAQLRGIERLLGTALDAAAAVSASLGDAAGPVLTGIGAHVGTCTLVGSGYLRHSRDVIRALRKNRRKT